MSKELNDLVPVDLFQKCYALISGTHKKIGFRELPKLLVQKQNMVVLALIPEANTTFETLKGFSKIQKGLYFLIVLTLIGVLFLNVWFLFVPIILFIISRRFLLTERKHWIFLASIILGLEILSIDFLEWGSFYPEFQVRAKELLVKNNPEENPTQLLDYYLPNRTQQDTSIFSELRP